MQSKDNEDELTFWEIKSLIIAIRNTTGSALRFTSNTVRKNLLLFSVSFCSIIAFCGWKYSNQLLYYEAKASFIYNDLHKKTYGEMLDKIRNLINNGSYQTAAYYLKTDTQFTAGIVDLKAVNIFGSRLSEDITSDKMPFYVIATVKDRNIFDTLSVIIENYFNNNRHAVSKTERRNMLLRQQIERNNRELEMLDTLKRKLPDILSNRSGKGNIDFEPVALYTKTLEISKDNSEKEDILHYYKSVEILDTFVADEYPVHKSLWRYLAEGIILFLATGFLLVAGLSIFKR